MIDLIFYFGSEVVFVRVQGTSVYMASGSNGNQMATIDGLQLSKSGVIKEYPDLNTHPNWKQEAIDRFKAKLRQLSSEQAIANYVIEDLKKHGYIPKYKQVAGFRREILK